MKTKTTKQPIGYGSLPPGPKKEPEGNKELKRLIALMHQLSEAARDWVHGHPHGCRCGFCRMDRHGENRRYIREDLLAAAWTCEAAASSIDGEIMRGYGDDETEAA